MHDLIRTFSERGDLAHLALFLWAACASACALFALRELAASARRFDYFVREAGALQQHLRSPQRPTRRQIMDNLHSVMRSIRGETRPVRRDHLTVFREFIDQLDRIGNRQNKALTKGRKKIHAESEIGAIPAGEPLACTLLLTFGAACAAEQQEGNNNRSGTYAKSSFDIRGSDRLGGRAWRCGGATRPPRRSARCRTDAAAAPFSLIKKAPPTRGTVKEWPGSRAQQEPQGPARAQPERSTTGQSSDRPADQPRMHKGQGDARERSTTGQSSPADQPRMQKGQGVARERSTTGQSSPADQPRMQRERTGRGPQPDFLLANGPPRVSHRNAT